VRSLAQTQTQTPTRSIVFERSRFNANRVFAEKSCSRLNKKSTQWCNVNAIAINGIE